MMGKSGWVLTRPSILWSFDEIANSPSFYYRFIDKTNPELDNENTLVIKPKKLFEKTDEIKYANNAFFHFLLFEKIIPRAKKEVVIKNSLTSFKKNENLKKHFDFEQALRKSTDRKSVV